MEWRQVERRNFPRLQSRIYELRRAASLSGMSAGIAKDGGSQSGSMFAYQSAQAEIEEIEVLLGLFAERSARSIWVGWQLWVVLLAALFSAALSMLSILRL